MSGTRRAHSDVLAGGPPCQAFSMSADDAGQASAHAPGDPVRLVTPPGRSSGCARVRARCGRACDHASPATSPPGNAERTLRAPAQHHVALIREIASLRALRWRTTPSARGRACGSCHATLERGAARDVRSHRLAVARIQPRPSAAALHPLLAQRRTGVGARSPRADCVLMKDHDSLAKPDYRATVPRGRLTLVHWHPWLMGGPGVHATLTSARAIARQTCPLCGGDLPQWKVLHAALEPRSS